MPIFGLDGPVQLEVEPPVTCSLQIDGVRVGWVLVFMLADEQFELLMDLFCEASAEGTAIMSRAGWSGKEMMKDPVLGKAFQSMMALKEWARCFCARPANTKSAKDNTNCFAFVNAKTEAKGWSAELQRNTKLFKQQPHGFGDGYKCCMAKLLSPSGCPSCGSTRMKTGCSRACQQRHQSMIWCKKCLIAPFCSRACKLNSAKMHELGCGLVAQGLREIGLGTVCFFCGVPGGTEGIALRRCARCEAAFYCSQDCQTADWKAGHSVDCVRSTESEGLGARASSSSQYRPASDCGASSDPRVQADGIALAATRADMEQTLHRMVQAYKGAGTSGPFSNLDPADPWQLVLASESVRTANAVKELESTGTVRHALRVGSIVMIHSLVSAKQHNNARGEVGRLPLECSDRYAVYLEHGDLNPGETYKINVRGRNLCDVTDLHRAAGLLDPGSAHLRNTGNWMAGLADKLKCKSQ